jgi:hypothetical protein
VAGVGIEVLYLISVKIRYNKLKGTGTPVSDTAFLGCWGGRGPGFKKE